MIVGQAIGHGRGIARDDLLDGPGEDPFCILVAERRREVVVGTDGLGVRRRGVREVASLDGKAEVKQRPEGTVSTSRTAPG